MRKAKVITVRLPAQQARAIRAAAKANDASIAAYLRAVIWMDFWRAGLPAPWPLPEPRATLRPLVD
jgi:hypothetical protein